MKRTLAFLSTRHGWLMCYIDWIEGTDIGGEQDEVLREIEDVVQGEKEDEGDHANQSR